MTASHPSARARVLSATALALLVCVLGALHLTGRPSCEDRYVRLLDVDGGIAVLGLVLGAVTLVPTTLALRRGTHQASARVAVVLGCLLVPLVLADLYLLDVDASGRALGCWTF